MPYLPTFHHGDFSKIYSTTNQGGLLDIDKWLGVFSFTVKLVSKNNEPFWGVLCCTSQCAPIDAIASGGMSCLHNVSADSRGTERVC
jgi:hypothetical protein